ncbi:hypothetical protein J2T09_002321 [Neorhizobium huautlense]|uniref:Restriction alleviation protein Lar n=1 Tax=Neorhizobium huautlense TaxID=67774 RepID=A0ABT9PSY7_9HYPH|nr:Lar family restriction alleviation protein [Neorhizobium huautlense]MDP9837569.1 hypothetical protein [Neorhizobium huautlense]
MITTNKLLPCPFCWSTASLETGLTANVGGDEIQYVTCVSCSAQADPHDWQTRPDAPAPQEHATGLWRVFDADNGDCGIVTEGATSDEDAILYPVNVYRDTLVRIVDAHNYCLTTSTKTDREDTDLCALNSPSCGSLSDAAAAPQSQPQSTSSPGINVTGWALTDARGRVSNFTDSATDAQIWKDLGYVVKEYVDAATSSGGSPSEH